MYVPGRVMGGIAAQGVQRTFTWVDRAGHEEPIKAPARSYQRVVLSPDGTRLALDIGDEDLDIWTWDLAHETLTRLTTDKAIDNYPVRTANSKRIIIGSARDGGVDNLYWQPADGSGPAERLTTNERARRALSRSRPTAPC